VLRHRQVWLLCLVGAGGGLTWATYLTFWAGFAQEELGLSKGAAGVVLGCSAVTIIPASLVAAWTVERVGSRRLFFVVATVAQVPLFGLWAVVEQPFALAVIGLAQGLSWIYFPIMLAVPFDLEGFDAQDVALATGMFFVANAAALTVGPGVSGVAAEWVSMRAVLLATALLPLLSTLGALFLVDSRRTPAAEVAAAAGG
jgi:predicted MFS family arabinose efflux permease